MPVSIKTAIECAKSVMWLGPHQQAIFVMRNAEGGACLADYDELQLLRGLGCDIEPEFVVVPSDIEGECIIL